MLFPFQFLSRRCYSSAKSCDPLRILFCGADDFSISSLHKLHELKISRPDCISSIHVVCRPDKAVGRKRQQIRPVPIKSTAQSLDLPLHQIDTFTGWTPPPTDLVVTVSFGLLVPARILTDAKYGGVNVHPSLLPDLRGPAPIQHALLQGRKITGVTLQTMHPRQFDRGAILAQKSCRVPEMATVEGMVDLLGEMGGEMLVAGIEHRVFVEPPPPPPPPPTSAMVTDADADLDGDADATHAPKITSQDRRIDDWRKVTREEIVRRDRVLGRLWDAGGIYGICCGCSSIHVHNNNNNNSKRVTFHGGWKTFAVGEVQVEHRISWQDDTEHSSASTGGAAVVIFRIPGVKGRHFGVELMEEDDGIGRLLAPNEATIEGEKKGQGLQVLINGIRARM